MSFPHLVAAIVAVAATAGACASVDRDQIGLPEESIVRTPAGFIPVVGDHLGEGFIRATDLTEADVPPSSPTEALAKNARPGRVIPVFASDGATQIDTFTEGSVDVPDGKRVLVGP